MFDRVDLYPNDEFPADECCPDHPDVPVGPTIVDLVD